MALDLESLKTEVQHFLKEAGLSVFYGQSRYDEFAIYWDTERHPDFREFLAVARSSGAALVVFAEQQFSRQRIDDALYQLDDCDLPREEARNLENRLRQFEGYEGFTCRLEISFDVGTNTYVFELDTDWHNAFRQIIGEIKAFLPGPEDEEEDEGPIGGYFSNN
jgi:hypothetical protein